MAVIEPGTVQGGLWAASGAIVTASTVGYGDIAPASPQGRIVATLLVLVGIGVVGTLAASIAAYFVGQDEADRLRAEPGDRRAFHRSSRAPGPRSPERRACRPSRGPFAQP